MRNLFYLLIICVLAFYSCKRDKTGYVIKAEIDGSNDMMFKLMIVEDNRLIPIDSAISRNNYFTMNGKLDYPRIVFLQTNNAEYRTSFFLENSQISVDGSLDSFTELRIVGSSIQDESVELTNALRPFGEQLESIEGKYQTASLEGNIGLMAQYEKEYDDVLTNVIEMQKNFVRTHPYSYIVPDILLGMANEIDAPEFIDILNGLSPEISNLPEIVGLKEVATRMIAIAVGQKAPDFTLNDVSGTPVSLYSKLGPKLLLLDFWAAWCNPCRQENPNVVKVYKEFNKKGFDVFGVSLDRTKEDWEKAIKDDKLTWTHVSDLNYWDNAAAKLYSVTAIPCNFLLDENGVIVARNLRGDALYNFVSERLK